MRPSACASCAIALSGRGAELCRGRTVPAGIGHLEPEVDVGLLSALPGPVDRLAGFFRREARGAVDVEHDVRVPEPLGDELGGLHRGLFVARIGHHDAPLRAEALPPELDQRGDRERGLELGVARAAAVDVAVLDHRGERVALPVFGPRLDHVHVRRDHHRPERRVAARPGGDQVRGIVDLHDLDVAFGPAAGEERAAEGLRDVGGAIAFALHRTQRDRLPG
jgi:hypothetical protein